MISVEKVERGGKDLENTEIKTDRWFTKEARTWEDTVLAKACCTAGC